MLLALPDDQHKLSDWTELSIDLRPLVLLFAKLQASARRDEGEGDGKRPRRDGRALPESFSRIVFVRVYANCRVRRVWCAQRPGVEFPLVAA